MTLVSIITPAYQPNPDYLLEAFYSFKEYPDWEWIIQFDGRKTSLPSEISSDPRVIVSPGFDDRNFGAAAARNYALAQTQGEYIRPLDADDYLTPGSLERSIKALQQHPQLGLEFSPALGLQDNVITPAAFALDEDYHPGVVAKEKFDSTWRQGKHLGLNFMSCCFNKQKLLATGIWPNLYTWEDVYITLRVAVIYGGFFTPQPGTVYRRHSKSITSSQYSQDMLRARELQAKLVNDSINAFNDLNNRQTHSDYLMPNTVQQIFRDKEK